MLKTNLKTLNKKIRKSAPILLLVIGAFFMFTSGLHWYFKYQSLSLDAELLAKHKQTTKEDSGLTPTNIYIQWFVDTPISKQVYENNNWTISEKEASYLNQSALPGENGNIIIYGHNTRSILGNIRALKGSEIIVLTTKNGVEHKYKVNLIVEVNPDEIKYLEPTPQETLTLYTCSGFLDKKRFIVQAIPVQTN